MSLVLQYRKVQNFENDFGTTRNVVSILRNSQCFWRHLFVSFNSKQESSAMWIGSSMTDFPYFPTVSVISKYHLLYFNFPFSIIYFIYFPFNLFYVHKVTCVCLCLCLCMCLCVSVCGFERFVCAGCCFVLILFYILFLVFVCGFFVLVAGWLLTTYSFYISFEFVRFL